MKLSIALALLAGTAVWAADPVLLDLQTGEWENTVTMQMTMPGQAPQQMPTIPPDQLAKMPPEMRAKFEATMKQASAMASGKPTTTTTKQCVKKEDLAKLNPSATKDQTCKTTLVSSSRTKQEMKIDCDSTGTKETGTVVIEALNSGSMKMNMQLAGTAEGKPMSMTINGTGKFLSATCTDTK